MPRKKRTTTTTTKKRKSTTAITRRKKASIKIDANKTREVYAVVFATLATLVLLGLYDKLGYFGYYFKEVLLNFFGQGAVSIPVIFGLLSVSFFTYKKISFDGARILGLFLIFFGFLGFLHTFLPDTEAVDAPHKGGGYIGFASSVLFMIFLGEIGSRVVLFSIFLVGVVFAFPFSLMNIFSESLRFVLNLLKPDSKSKESKKEPLKIKVKESKPQEVKIVRPDFEEKVKESSNKPEKKEAKKPLIYKTDEDWEFPSLDLLSSDTSKIHSNEKLLMKQAESIKGKLMEFGVDVEMGNVHTGPTVTQFTLKPSEGVKLTKITNLKTDLALALSAKSLRIEAPIPGKDLVGIEIPNEKRTIVRLREILESNSFLELESNLRLAVGRDVSGESISYDLAEMPHLLMAGATGAGKSVGMNTFLLSLLFQNSPNQLKMILIDPKRVELAPYNGVPHLLTPVITEADKALSALKWSVAEMMRRYTEMSEKGFRNIAEYNASEEEKMPNIIIVIDELADLMMRQFKKETEAAICRIAQMARAVGMHLIIATQRPSVDVITGLIKANIPTRISFAVTSSIDSRTILDATGAEDLLGKGDMLITSPKLAKPQRVQGIMVDGEEINKVINRIKLTKEPEFDESILQEQNPAPNNGQPIFTGSDSGDSDDLLEEAIEVVRSTGKASASLLQRRLSVGYARAARILDIMEEKGMIGPAKGAKAREIYL
ncbi:MAG: DNA translocase FtsK [Candidatus Gracilibacteria bacterium]|jgi:S-DNA-T family DNA segregation ATPase FtsK/SpoIIIE|nr:DNA translocase FtsK [Candidatus Gracilibacteria bacterium]